MVLVCENIHPRGLDFQNQRKVVILRDVQGLSFVDIAAQVKNLAGKQPSPRTCCQYYEQFSVSRGRKKTAYNNCGRRPWKLTTATQGFVLRSLRRMRKQGMCTTKSLQAELARARGVAVDQSTIRKFLQAQGYRWLPRGQKRRYTPQQMSKRKAFAEAVVALFFFRPTPYGSRQVVYQAGKPVAFCKFTELMQWQHHHDDHVHQKEN